VSLIIGRTAAFKHRPKLSPLYKGNCKRKEGSCAERSPGVFQG
jgi:hypothetical protein